MAEFIPCISWRFLMGNKGKIKLREVPRNLRTARMIIVVTGHPASRCGSYVIGVSNVMCLLLCTLRASVWCFSSTLGCWRPRSRCILPDEVCCRPPQWGLVDEVCYHPVCGSFPCVSLIILTVLISFNRSFLSVPLISLAFLLIPLLSLT